MKTALIFTGGTIGSTMQNGRISPDTQTMDTLTQSVAKKYGTQGDFAAVSPYTALSENLNADRLNALITCVQTQIAAGCGRIIVFHGTDTLAYTAAALSYAFGSNSLPIVLVSANYPAEDARSNAYPNLYGALDFLQQTDAHGVFVVYKNQNGPVFVHRAARLIEQNAFDDAVYSAADLYFGKFDENNTFHKNSAYEEAADEIAPFGNTPFCPNSGVLRLLPCPGMPLPALDDRVQAVLLNSYHSGSIGTQSTDFEVFCREAYAKQIPIFLCGQNSNYESAAAFDRLHVRALGALTPVCAYMKLWLLCSTDRNWCKLTQSLGGDQIIIKT